MAKRPQRKAKPRRREKAPAPERGSLSSERELIVVAKQDLGLRATREGVRSVRGADVSPLTGLLASEGVTLRPLFGVSEERLQARRRSLVAEAGRDVPDLSFFYRVEAPDERLDDLADQLREMEEVEAAYVKPPAEPAQELNDMLPRAEEAPPVTPDFTARQLYLDPAPGGIDARYAWTRTGGRGQNVRIIDIEGAWRFSHEDLLQNQGGVIGGTQSMDIGWRNHGTAVTGEFGADDNTIGVTGICPEANVRAISIFGGTGSAGAIRQAADALSAGDIILIELHRPGPRFNFQNRPDQMGYIAVEWWPDDFAAIQYATGLGVIVVEAAGNGAENLDDPIYATRPAGFPVTWTNPFGRGSSDSGAIVVGAGAPPPGTHGRNHGADRSRLGFSNWGALIDAQGWGREVTTTGYGDLQGGVNEDEWYTDTFSGTSSASPIIVGALGCMQGVLQAHSKALLTPATARNILRTTGSPQQDEPGRPATQRIGNRPDLRQAIIQLIGKPIKEFKDKDLKEFKEFKEKDRKEFKEFKEFKEKDLKEFKDKDLKEKDLKEKDFKDLKDIREVVIKPGQVAGAAPEGTAPSVSDRLTQLEETVASLAHFITEGMRPNVQAGTYAQEPQAGQGAADLSALSQELAKQAAAAKQAKDDKDAEKVREV